MRLFLKHFIFVLFLIFLSCLGEKKYEPSIRISDEEMIAIVSDMLVLQSAFNESVGTAKDSMSEVYIRQIEERHGYSMDVIEDNLKSLSYEQDRIDSIYLSVIDQLDSLKRLVE